MSNVQDFARPLPQVYERLGIGQTKLYYEIKAGRLKTIRIGRKVLVLDSEIDRYLAARVAEAEQRVA